MAENLRLTKRTIDRLRADDRERTYWDSEVTGFGVRVLPSGSKTFVLMYRAGKGRTARLRKITLCKVGDMTPDEARDLARIARGQVAGGEDPAKLNAAKRRELTVKQIADRYLAEHVRPHNKPSWATQVDLHLKVHILPEFGAKRIGELSREDIVRWHARKPAGPYGSNRCLAVLRKMLTLANRDWELIESNPALGIKLHKETSRQRFFGDEEIARIGKWLAKTEDDEMELPHFILATRLLLLTGMRLGEVLTLRWKCVDLPNGLLRLPDAKTGARPVALNPEAVACLANASKGGIYVCGPGTAKEPLSKGSYHTFWRRLRKATELTDARPHDFRHTVATLGAMGGANAFILRDLLGHKTVAITSGYVARSVDPVREVSNAVGRRIAQAMKMPASNESADVVPLRRGRVVRKTK